MQAPPDDESYRDNRRLLRERDAVAACETASFSSSSSIPRLILDPGASSSWGGRNCCPELVQSEYGESYPLDTADISVSDVSSSTTATLDDMHRLAASSDRGRHHAPTRSVASPTPHPVFRSRRSVTQLQAQPQRENSQNESDEDTERWTPYSQRFGLSHRGLRFAMVLSVYLILVVSHSPQTKMTSSIRKLPLHGEMSLTRREIAFPPQPKQANEMQELPKFHLYTVAPQKQQQQQRQSSQNTKKEFQEMQKLTDESQKQPPQPPTVRRRPVLAHARSRESPAFYNKRFVLSEESTDHPNVSHDAEYSWGTSIAWIGLCYLVLEAGIREVKRQWPAYRRVRADRL